MYESLIEATVLPLPPDELMIPWDAVTLPAIAFVLTAIWGWWQWSVIRDFWEQFRSQSDKSDKLYILNSFAFGVLGLILVILFFGVLAAIGKLGVSLLSPSERDEESLRWLGLTIFGLLTALGGILGAPLAIIRINTTERQTRVEEEETRIKSEEANIKKREHITNLLNRATEHLGASLDGKPNIPLRIGGLLALERIVQDNIEDYDLQIMEMICAYIRANSPHVKEPRIKPISIQLHSAAKEDIRVAIYILSDHIMWNILWGSVQNEREYQLNLDRTNLTGIDFMRRNRNANFSLASFGDCCLVCANFLGADLSCANFKGADLRGADLRGATVMGTKFDDAEMEETKPDKSVILEYVEKDERIPYR